MHDDMISRQDAIDQLHQSYNLLDAERRLEDMPSSQPEQRSFSCGQENDLISRQLLCDYALNQKDKCITPNDIMRFPSAQLERKKGKWVRITQGAIREKYICPFCHRRIENDGVESLLSMRFPFCHCGADMRGEQGEADRR